MIFDNLYRLCDSYYIQSALLAWLLAQLTKTIIVAIRHGGLNLERMVGSGGFPSSHTALIVSITTAIGITYGVDSAIFALALVFSLIVMYDASGVRRAAGRQAEILNELIRHLATRKIKISKDGELLKELLGHTPFEVFGGIILGIIVAFGLYVFRFC